ncbi:hypothetical protein VIGAN_03205800, partial [Vigna angularis var. angularis]
GIRKGCTNGFKRRVFKRNTIIPNTITSTKDLILLCPIIWPLQNEFGHIIVAAFSYIIHKLVTAITSNGFVAKKYS